MAPLTRSQSRRRALDEVALPSPAVVKSSPLKRQASQELVSHRFPVSRQLLAVAKSATTVSSVPGTRTVKKEEEADVSLAGSAKDEEEGEDGEAYEDGEEGDSVSDVSDDDVQGYPDYDEEEPTYDYDDDEQPEAAPTHSLFEDPEHLRCYCGVPASCNTVRKFGPNTGRPFAGCANWMDPAQKCTFFIFRDTLRGGDRQGEGPPAILTCDCDLPAAMRQAGPNARRHNVGRWYGECHRRGRGGCVFWRWGDGSAPFTGGARFGGCFCLACCC